MTTRQIPALMISLRHMEQEVASPSLSLIHIFRPFPTEAVRKYLSHVPVIGVMDRSAGLGGIQPPVCTEVTAALYGAPCDIRSYIGGLAGRDISNHSFEKIFGELLDIKSGKTKEHGQWFDVKEDPMDIRMEIWEEED